MSTRTREDKKARKEIRKFFASKSGRELTFYVKQNGILKIVAMIAALVIIAEAAVIWRML